MLGVNIFNLFNMLDVNPGIRKSHGDTYRTEK